jgi:hypothetical protein
LVLVLVSVLVLFPDPDNIYQRFSTTTKNFVQNVAFSMLEVALFPRKIGLSLFFVGSGSKSGAGSSTMKK